MINSIEDLQLRIQFQNEQIRAAALDCQPAMGNILKGYALEFSMSQQDEGWVLTLQLARWSKHRTKQPHCIWKQTMGFGAMPAMLQLQDALRQLWEMWEKQRLVFAMYGMWSSKTQRDAYQTIFYG